MKMLSFNASLLNVFESPLEIRGKTTKIFSWLKILFIKLIWFNCILVGLEDASPEGSSRMIYRGNSLLSIPSYFDNGVTFELNIRKKGDKNGIVNFLYQLKDQKAER